MSFQILVATPCLVWPWPHPPLAGGRGPPFLHSLGPLHLRGGWSEGEWPPIPRASPLPPPRHGLPPILPSPRLAGARHSLPARSLGAGRVPRCLLPPALLERKLPRTNDSGPLVAAPNRAQCYWTGGLTEGPAWRWALKKGGRPLETSRPQPGIAGDTHGVTPARPSLCPAWAAWARGRMRPWTKRTHAFGLCEWCSGLFEAAGSKLTVYRLALVSETCPHPPPPHPKLQQAARGSEAQPSL